ncbi:hypothetical protein AX17_003763 [Amanita inopinata Kibby_2008]|nr:hypothetical protein AX17_003763 [Amanita inopinata Kibby_2008]
MEFFVSLQPISSFFGKEKDARRIDLLNASTDCLEHLVGACDPATFGRGHEDVHDESYRKAGKLGRADFSPTLDPTNLGLIHVLRQTLLRGPQAKRHIHAELYNINVYGEGSFFKAHKDTPRNERMFGSLEWMFDSAKKLAAHNEPVIGYTAFYSDVEPEVALVTSGYRVTVTYNLYFDESVSIINVPLSADVLAFGTAFETLLGDPEFLPDGGHLGFGLEYEYPLPGYSTPFNSLEKRLKGSDAEIMDIIKELSLDVSLWGLIKAEDFTLACKDYFPDYTRYDAQDWSLAGWLQDEYLKCIPFASTFTYIGFQWELDKKTVCLPDKKRERYLANLELQDEGYRPSCDEVESLVGMLNHITLILPAGRAHLVHLYKLRTTFDQSRNQWVRNKISNDALDDLKW